MKIRKIVRNKKKELRKLLVKEKLRNKKMSDVFSQLSLIDDAGIRRRVNFDMKNYKSPNCVFPHLAEIKERLYRSYQYALEITNTILV